ncbi:MAG: sensor histidine kinase [Methylococcales bacterium]|nr:sensor histidine kinase [Methylococcales bacterium]
MKINTLCYQINIRILFLSLCVFAIGAIGTLWHAKEAVQNEMQSSVHLAEQLITFELSKPLASTEWIKQLQALKATRHLRIQLKDPAGKILKTTSRQDKTPVNPPLWFVKLVSSSPTQIERALITNDGQALIVMIEANPLNEIDEVWEESVALFGLLFLLMTLVFTVIRVMFNRVLKAIRLIVEGLERLEKKDYQNRLPEFSSHEMNLIANAINKLISKLDASQQENRALTQHTLTIQEDERQRLAQDLHDELGQSLTAIKVMTATIARMNDTQNTIIKQSTTSVIEICDHLMKVVRSMMQQLHPLTLTELGLKAALHELCDSWRLRCPTLQIDFQCDEHIEHCQKAINIHLFRIIQECLTNVFRHAHAEKVSIILAVELNKNLLLTITDNGRGCDATTIKNGFGLFSMQERVRSLNGEFTIETNPKQGMKICVSIPYSP